MRQETNNEMDLLLRRLGRRDGAASTGGNHLDADELSAYAENVLPTAARARYSEHLAECSRCRELVIQLSSAAGVVVAQDAVKIPQPSLLKKLFASFLSPMVLRYAVPALGFIIVGFIGLVVLRRERSAELMARMEQPSSTAVAVPSAQQPDQKIYDAQTKPQSYADNRPNKQAGPVKSVEPAPANSAPVVNVTPAGTPEARGQKAEQSAGAATNEPPAKEAPKPAAPIEKRQQQSVEVEARKEKLESPTPTIQPSADKMRVEDREVKDLSANRDARSAKRAPVAGAAAAPNTRGLATVSATADKAGKADSSETRSVVGHRFRKDRGIWIDTAYNSQATTTLTRGSEHYRAVVADEPEIKSIADQLDGEIIVMWKGRAYRIK
jgi:Putative zinc-finger